MNDARRKQIQEALDIMQKVLPQLEDAKSILETVKDEEQEAFDNMPEGLQASDNGQKLEENVAYLQEAMYLLHVLL